MQVTLQMISLVHVAIGTQSNSSGMREGSVTVGKIGLGLGLGGREGPKT